MLTEILTVGQGFFVWFFLRVPLLRTGVGVMIIAFVSLTSILPFCTFEICHMYTNI